MHLSLKNNVLAIAAVLACLSGANAFAQDGAATVPEAPYKPPKLAKFEGIADGACHDGHDGPVIQLGFDNLKNNKGQFRIELYGNNPDLFLEGAGRVYKYFVPMIKKRKDTVCLAVPHYGEYGLLVIHDMDGDSKPDFFTDGFGLSTNPQLALRRPQLDEARFTIDQDETSLEIKLQYVTGSGNKKDRDRKRR